MLASGNKTWDICWKYSTNIVHIDILLFKIFWLELFWLTPTGNPPQICHVNTDQKGAQPVLSKALRNTLKMMTTEVTSHNYTEKPQILNVLSSFLFGFFLLRNKITVDQYFRHIHLLHNIAMMHILFNTNLRVSINSHASGQKWWVLFNREDREPSHLHSIPISTRLSLWTWQASHLLCSSVIPHVKSE